MTITIYAPADTPSTIPTGMIRLVVFNGAKRRQFAIVGKDAHDIVRAGLSKIEGKGGAYTFDLIDAARTARTELTRTEAQAMVAG